MKSKIVLYEHAGSSNHGCEAIIRSTVKLFQEQEMLLSSFVAEEDYRYGVEDICQVEQCSNSVKKNIKYYVSRVVSRVFHDNTMFWNLSFEEFFNRVQPGDIYFSTGGDNYCYDTKIEGCLFLNKNLKQQGAKTVLWGVSIEPEIIKQRRIREDLKRYDLIVARETITYQALVENGISQVCLCPDPAFLLNTAEVDYPASIEQRDIVGINISPMILDSAKDAEMVLKNYWKLLDYILEETDYAIAMIPHVVWNGGDDRVVIEKIVEKYKGNNRIFIVQDASCEVLKGYIAKCRFFVGARTHTTIAAYSSNIPTLVVGYSVKAKGIAKDLFGTEEHLVLPVQDMEAEEQLVSAFQWIEKNESTITKQLIKSQSNYSEQYKICKERIYKLF